ncbi:fimbria/pilus periplasmic chaperone [Photobacterium damselae]|uniref:fimbria/pilus periplasmic chaperone n=1 Tax=Photobacterium damselae TaxID=38293 RepID=UPI002542809E
MKMFLLFFALFSSYVLGLEISPMVQEWNLSESQRNKMISLYNDSNQRVAIEVISSNIDQDKNDINHKLQVFPPAFLIEPGKRQNVMLVWSDNSVLQSSQSYFVSFIQHPTAKDSDAGIQIRIRYNAVVHITSNNLLDSVNVVSVENTSTGLNAEIVNSGNKYARLEDYQMLLIDLQGKAFTVTSSQISPNSLFLYPQQKKSLFIDTSGRKVRSIELIKDD